MADAKTDAAAAGAGASASSWEALKEQGNKFYAATSYESAAEAYSKALADASITAEAKVTIICNRAQCRLMLKQFDKAVEDATAVLALEPEHVKALFRRGTAYESMDKKEEALADFRAVRKINPAVAGAAAAIRRLETALRGDAAGAGGGKGAGGGGGGSGGGRVFSDEDKAHMAELQARVANVAQQLKAAQDTRQGVDTGKKRLELTAKELADIPDGTKVYEAVGKMFVLETLDKAREHVTGKIEKQASRLEKVDSTIAYLQKAQAEADANFLEAAKELRSR